MATETAKAMATESAARHSSEKKGKRKKEGEKRENKRRVRFFLCGTPRDFSFLFPCSHYLQLCVMPSYAAVTMYTSPTLVHARVQKRVIFI
jgi:hypothetical protein